jgi:exoribonuclease R
MKEKQEKIIWKFQAGEHFWFVIPKNRDFYGWDFYVRSKNFWGAEEWDKVEAVEIKSSGKKPEVKIIKVFWKIPEWQTTMWNFVEWVYSSWAWNFWFIDIEWQKKWYFVYWEKRWKAKDWDLVKAQIVEYKWKKEAIIVKVFENEFGTAKWIFKDNGNFGFVITEDNWDIFIPGMKKNWAKDGDTVEVKITKKWKKNKEGIII